LSLLSAGKASAKATTDMKTMEADRTEAPDGRRHNARTG
jgi:hypothetical protein